MQTTTLSGHFQASRKSRLESAATAEKEEEAGSARYRSRSNPRQERTQGSCPPGFVRPQGPLALEDAKDNTETTPRRSKQQTQEQTPPPVSRRNMIKATAAADEGEARGADRQSEGGKREKDQIGNANKALKDLALQLEARLRIQEGATSNTVRLKCDHPLAEKLKETGDMYNKAVMNNQGHTMGPPHFHYMLGLLDWLAVEETEKEKIEENKDKLDTRFLKSLREALARRAAAADKMDDWELDMLFRSCRLAADYQKKKTEATSRISFAIAGSVLVDNVPEKYHSHPLVAKVAHRPDSRLARIELQLVVTLLLVEHGAVVLAGPAPRGSKARQLLDKEK